MTTKEKLQSICNYVEKKNLQQKQIQVSIVQTISSDDEEYIREQKEKNRDLAIDITLGNKEESEWEKREQWEQSSHAGAINTITPRLTILSINASPFTDHDSVYKEVIDFLDKKTSGPVSSKTIGQPQLNYTISNDSNLTSEENYEANIRRIITRVMACSNLIALDGRVGPGTSIIIGENNWEYFKHIDFKHGKINGMEFIYDSNIDPNKVIIARSNSKNNPGIFVIENERGGKYDFFIKESSNWSKQFCWFWIN